MPSKRFWSKFEESLPFMVILTFIGGFINAYSFFTRGGAFVSFHTGNIMRVGIAAATLDLAMFGSSIIPILGAFLGAILAQLFKAILSKRSIHFWQLAALITEFAAFLVVGFIPESYPHTAVNFSLSLIIMFQLSNFRTLNGAAHNTTIETGNLRTLGQHCGNILLNRNLPSLKVACQYAVAFLAFPFGALIGGLLSSVFHIHSIWFCCVLLFILWFCLWEHSVISD